MVLAANTAITGGGKLLDFSRITTPASKPGSGTDSGGSDNGGGNNGGTDNGGTNNGGSNNGGTDNGGTDSSGTANEGTDSLPKTGSPINLGMIVITGIALEVLGCTLVLSNKRKRRD